MKERILTLLETTTKSYRLIAIDMQCSESYVRGLHKELINSKKQQLCKISKALTPTKH